MAKVDCTELEKAIYELAMAFGAQEGVETLDDVVAQMQRSFPVMPRQEIVNSIVNATGREIENINQLKKKLNEIKRNARMEQATTEKITKLETYLESGKLPDRPKSRKLASETLQQARATVRNLRKWLQTADPAMKKTLQEKLDALNQRIEAGDVIIEEGHEGEFHEALKNLAEQVEAARREIASARVIKVLEAKVEELQQHLEAGTVPEVKTRPERGTGPADLLRDIIDDLKKQLAASEPAQKAKIQKQIEALKERLAAGDFVRPKPPELAQTMELQRLGYERDQLRKRVRAAIIDLRPRSFWYRVADPFNAIRTLKTAFDFSAVLRQGGFIALGHWVRTAKALGPMFAAFADPMRAGRINSEILERANAPLYARAKLYLAPTDGTVSLAQREEAFMSRLAEHIPGVAASQRAYVTFLNVLRADSFDTMAATLSATGEPTIEEAQAIATFINEATGRGSLGALENAAVGLNTGLFAPRYVASRFQLLVFHPLWGGTSQTRKLIAQEYGRFLAGLAAVYILGLLAGGDLEGDPRSSDFGKIRFGRTRLDPLAGISQTAVLTARLGTALAKQVGLTEARPVKSSVSGKVRELQAGDVGRFLRSKLSPTFGIPLDVVLGKNVVGEKVTPTGALLEAPVPIALRDIYDAMQEQGVPAGTALAMLSIFGMGLQTYD